MSVALMPHDRVLSAEEIAPKDKSSMNETKTYGGRNIRGAQD